MRFDLLIFQRMCREYVKLEDSWRQVCKLLRLLCLSETACTLQGCWVTWSCWHQCWAGFGEQNRRQSQLFLRCFFGAGGESQVWGSSASAVISASLWSVELVGQVEAWVRVRQIRDTGGGARGRHCKILTVLFYGCAVCTLISNVTLGRSQNLTCFFHL